MPHSIRSAAVLLALVATLAIAPVAPEAGNVTFLTVAVLSLLLMFRGGAAQLGRPVVWMTLSGLALIAIAYVIGAKTVEGLIGLAYFSPLFAVLPLLASADELKDEDSSGLFALLALGGAAGPAVVAIQEFVGTGTMRAGGAIANPIHFADIALLVGFIACAGLVRPAGRWRFLLLVGPLLSAAAVVLSGTRGAVLALAVMLAVAGMMIVVLRLVSRRVVLVTFALLVAGGAVAVWLGAAHLSGIQRVVVDLAGVANGALPSDEGSAIRFNMLRGGYAAFLAAPIFGHGPIMFVHMANNLIDAPFGLVPHLHNDIADFAASAGMVGLVAYVLFMLAPIVEVARMPASPVKPRIMVLAVTLMSGYFFMGLTNAMFGILAITTYYAAICIIVGILTRQASNAP